MTSAAATGLYEDAEIYDILHAPGTPGEVRGLERTAQRFSGSNERLTWLEPACGSGRYLIELARRGHRGIGFDLNASMIRFARSRWTRRPKRPSAADRNGSCRFFIADMTDFDGFLKPTPIDAAFNLINTIRHLESDAAMLKHLRSVHDALRPGGIYLVGLSLTWYGREMPSEDIWRGSRKGTTVKQVVQFIPPRSPADRFEQVHSHLVVKRGDDEEHRDSSYRLRCYGRGQWRSLIARSPLELAAVVDADGDEHDPGPFGYAVYVLRRPSITRSRQSG